MNEPTSPFAPVGGAHSHSGQPAEAEFTDARTAFMQIGQTPSLQGLRVELRIEGYPTLIGNYAGAGMRRLEGGILAIEPMLLFAWTDTDSTHLGMEPF